MILAGRSRGIGFAVADIVTDQAGVLGFAQAVGALITRAGYKVAYETNIPGMTPPSACVFAYKPDGKLGASQCFSGAGLPRRSATDLAGEMLTDLEAGYIPTLPTGLTEAEKDALRRIDSYTGPLIRSTEPTRYVNGDAYRQPETQDREPGNTDTTVQRETTSERIEQQVTEDATSGFSFGGVSVDTKTLLIAGAALAALFFFGRKS